MGHRFTQMNTDKYNGKHINLSDDIIRIFYKVYNKLGYGFLEKVYENSMMIESKREGVRAVSQAPIKVLYDNEIVGEYFADILVDNRIILEIKAVRSLLADHEAQLLNYLKATEFEVGLLLNFGPKPVIKRRIFDNILK